MPKLPSVKNIEGLEGKRVLLRASLNVPVESGEVKNSFRVQRALPTIKFLSEAGARVVVIAHLGKGEADSLEPVYRHLQSNLNIKWCPEVTGPVVKTAVDQLEAGGVLLLENLRSDAREKENDTGFAEELAALAEVFVNDAFAASHREHASLVKLPTLLPSYFGFNFIHEYEALSRAVNPPQPALFILGGSKFETKLPLVKEYAKRYSHVFVGGAHANDLFRAQGFEIGQSMVSNSNLEVAGLLEKENILLPVDVTVSGPNGTRLTTPEQVKDDEKILDAGPRTIVLLSEHIKASKLTLWNGPLGSYEEGFAKHTEDLAKVLAEHASYAIVGGGDTVASIQHLDIEDKFSFISTAGGAMLYFLEHGTLPAIEVVIKK